MNRKGHGENKEVDGDEDQEGHGDDFEARKRKLLSGSRGKSYMLLVYTMIPITVFANSFMGWEFIEKMKWNSSYTKVKDSIVKFGKLQLAFNSLYTKAYHEISIVPPTTIQGSSKSKNNLQRNPFSR